MNSGTGRNVRVTGVKRWIFMLVLSVGMALTACDGSRDSGLSGLVEPLTRIGDSAGETDIVQDHVTVSEGQVVYVPAYSHVYHKGGGQIGLAITLSIRNTSRTDNIFVRSVRYYDSTGKLVKSYNEGTLRLGSLATMEFFIPEQDTSGGSGANFIVEWASERKQVNTPVIEAVMITTHGQQGIAFVRPGHIIQSLER